jgi:two-component system chemotaxis response regulator CheY
MMFHGTRNEGSVMGMKTVLIVDKSTAMRQLLSFALKDAGYWVVSAATKEDAVDTLDGSKIEMVIIGLNEKKEAMAFIKEVRSKTEYRSTPIVILAGDSRERKSHRAAKIGESALIMKPFTPKQLIDVVRQFSRSGI